MFCKAAVHISLKDLKTKTCFDLLFFIEKDQTNLEMFTLKSMSLSGRVTAAYCFSFLADWLIVLSSNRLLRHFDYKHFSLYAIFFLIVAFLNLKKSKNIFLNVISKHYPLKI